MARGFKGTKEEQMIAKLLREEEVAKLEKNKDKFNLAPVKKGWLRGFVINMRQSEEQCEYGLLQILEFEISDTLKGPGVPVRMSGTYFSGRLMDGAIVEVADPTPSVRPVTPDLLFRPHTPGENELRAFFPGRGETPRRKTLTLGMLGLLLPVIGLIAALIALYVLDII